MLQNGLKVTRPFFLVRDRKTRRRVHFSLHPVFKSCFSRIYFFFFYSSVISGKSFAFFIIKKNTNFSGQCPFKHGKVATDVPNPHAFDEDLPRFPGTEPEDTFIQTTFVHRDKDGWF